MCSTTWPPAVLIKKINCGPFHHLSCPFMVAKKKKLKIYFLKYDIFYRNLVPCTCKIQFYHHL